MSHYFTPPERTPIGEQTELIIDKAKKLGLIHVEGLRQSLLNAEARNELEFTYLGTGNIKYFRSKRYNCYLRIVDAVFHYYVKDDLAQSVLFD